jgi:hypothetical protein
VAKCHQSTFQIQVRLARWRGAEKRLDGLPTTSPAKSREGPSSADDPKPSQRGSQLAQRNAVHERLLDHLLGVLGAHEQAGAAIELVPALPIQAVPAIVQRFLLARMSI